MAGGAASESSVTGAIEEADEFLTPEDSAVVVILDTACSVE